MNDNQELTFFGIWEQNAPICLRGDFTPCRKPRWAAALEACQTLFNATNDAKISIAGSGYHEFAMQTLNSFAFLTPAS